MKKVSVILAYSMEKISISLFRGNIIRGLAILAVLLLHIFPYLKGIYHGSYQLFFVLVDQMARFCVPAFFMLSGYGLALKYQKRKINYVPYILERLSKLLPLYFLWSIASILIVSSIPAWSFGNQPASIVTQLLLGQADYQLYFLPVLVQLYVLFPLLLPMLRKNPKLVVFLSFLLQIALYAYYASNASNSDRYEYVFSLSWIAYFILGMYIHTTPIPKKTVQIAPTLTIIFLGLVTYLNVRSINAGVDPLPVLKFTKLILVPYIIFVCLSLFSAPQTVLTNLPKSSRTFLLKCLEWLGKNSFIIFLSHTIGFRIVYAIIHAQLEPWVLLRTILFWIALILMSQKMIGTNFGLLKKRR